MATSGTAAFQQNRNQLILRAGRQVGAWASGEAPDAQQIQDWSDALNAMVKSWEATGLHLWSETEGVLFPQPSQVQYLFGPGSSDHAANATGLVETATSAASAAGAGSLPVSSISGIFANQILGVYLDAGSWFWTTVSGAPSGNMISLTNPLPSSAASGNAVYAYAAAIDRPLRVLAVRRYNIASSLDTPISLMSRLDYRDLPNKTNAGLINQCFYDPQLTNGVFSVWQAPVDGSYLVKFTYMRQLQDFTTAVNTPDFPQEWTNALTWNLAKEMMVEYGVPEPRGSRIMQRAAETLDLASGFDRESESIYAGVNFDGGSR